MTIIIVDKAIHCRRACVIVSEIPHFLSADRLSKFQSLLTQHMWGSNYPTHPRRQLDPLLIISYILLMQLINLFTTYFRINIHVCKQTD